MKEQFKPTHTVFPDDSNGDEGPSLKKLKYDSTKDYEKIAEEKKKRRESAKEASSIEAIVEKSRSEQKKKKAKEASSIKATMEKSRSEHKKTKKEKKKKHIVCLSSDEDEFSKKSITNSMAKKEKKFDRKKYDSTREASPIQATVEKHSSDRKKSKESIDLKNGSLNEEVILIDSSIIEKKLKSNLTKKSNKTDRKTGSFTADASPVESIVKRSKSDSEDTEKTSDRKKRFSTEEASQMDTVVEKSNSDSIRTIEKNPSLDVDQNQESLTEDIPLIKPVKRINPYEKRNETVIKCPMCVEYGTNVLTTLRLHLKNKHHTTLGLAALFFRCECGHESQSATDGHLSKCTISNYTLIRKGDGPIRTIHDKKVTPQCIRCEEYPRTAIGYTLHLERHHQTSLKANQKYLICSCGHEVTSNNSDSYHRKKCDGRNYTMHELDEK